MDKVPQIKSIDKRTGMVMVRSDRNYKNRNNVLAVRIGGQDWVIVFNERNQRAMRMVESLKNLDAEQLGWMMGKVAKATRYLSAINTQYNPVFGIVNGVCNVQSAVLNISSTQLRGKAWQVLKAVPAAMRAIWKIERQGRSGTAYDQIYDDMQMSGGTTGYREIFRMGADRVKALQVEFARRCPFFCHEHIQRGCCYKNRMRRSIITIIVSIIPIAPVRIIQLAFDNAACMCVFFDVVFPSAGNNIYVIV